MAPFFTHAWASYETQFSNAVLIQCCRLAQYGFRDYLLGHLAIVLLNDSTGYVRDIFLGLCHILTL